jgi:hypothetical protein
MPCSQSHLFWLCEKAGCRLLRLHRAEENSGFLRFAQVISIEPGIAGRGQATRSADPREVRKRFQFT